MGARPSTAPSARPASPSSSSLQMPSPPVAGSTHASATSPSAATEVLCSPKRPLLTQARRMSAVSPMHVGWYGVRGRVRVRVRVRARVRVRVRTRVRVRNSARVRVRARVWVIGLEV